MAAKKYKMSLQLQRTDIIVESLTDRHGKSVEIQIRMPDCFVNATRICSSYDKEWAEFKRLPRTVELMTNFMEMGMTNMVATTMTGRVRESWVHPDIAIALLIWCNSKFHAAATVIVRKYLAGHVRTEDSLAAANQLSAHVVVSAEPSEQAEAPHAPPRLTPHQQTRVDSFALHTHLSDALNKVLDDIGLQLNNKSVFFAKANDMCNRALLNLDCTTDSLKRKRGIPKDLSIPAMLSTRQLRDLNMIRMNLVDYIRDDADLLRQMTTVAELDAWFAEKREMLTKGASGFGYHVRTVDNLLPVSEARAQARELTKIRRQHALPMTTEASHVTGAHTLRMLVQPRPRPRQLTNG